MPVYYVLIQVLEINKDEDDIVILTIPSYQTDRLPLAIKSAQKAVKVVADNLRS